MAKGFRIPARTARLVFEGDYAGAEVVVRLDLPIGQVLSFLDQSLSAEDGQTPATAKANLILLQRFAATALISWNLENDEGQPIPATAEGILQVPVVFAQLLLAKWAEAISNPPDPLAGVSANGSTSGPRTVEMAPV